ncbi:hypothetical protein KGM_202724 [Danaus plexippus plexippus]|uniref:Uncharacterized protein n=1 Tax=Danaus plexippus plexippus TaxID=278856 RepID=A0A212FKY1_DANPL|nr:hypothetical protein KGM_202724 [Danaus plexippus plexippus]
MCRQSQQPIKGLPSWSRGLEAAEAARVRLFRWACGEANDEPPRKKMPHALRRRWPMCPCLQVRSYTLSFKYYSPLRNRSLL